MTPRAETHCECEPGYECNVRQKWCRPRHLASPAPAAGGETTETDWEAINRVIGGADLSIAAFVAAREARDRLRAAAPASGGPSMLAPPCAEGCPPEAGDCGNAGCYRAASGGPGVGREEHPEVAKLRERFAREAHAQAMACAHYGEDAAAEALSDFAAALRSPAGPPRETGEASLWERRARYLFWTNYDRPIWAGRGEGWRCYFRRGQRDFDEVWSAVDAMIADTPPDAERDAALSSSRAPGAASRDGEGSA